MLGLLLSSPAFVGTALAVCFAAPFLVSVLFGSLKMGALVLAGVFAAHQLVSVDVGAVARPLAALVLCGGGLVAVVVVTSPWALRLPLPGVRGRQVVWSLASVALVAVAWAVALTSCSVDLFSLVASTVLGVVWFAVDPEVLNADDAYYHGDHIALKHRLFLAFCVGVPFVTALPPLLGWDTAALGLADGASSCLHARALFAVSVFCAACGVPPPVR